MEVYLEKLSAFSRLLRLKGLPVSPAETADAAQTLIALGMADREQVKAALRTVFASSREEQLAFDSVFEGFFITEEEMRRQAQEQQQREQIIQLSHELKTPLAVIEGNADLLAEDEALTPEQREQVEAILRGTEQTRTYLLKIRAQVQTPLKYKRP
mgnify:CR=1 FL=1